MRPFGLAPLAVAVAAAFVASEAFALPTGSEIRAGQGAVTSPKVGSVVVRQDSARLAIDWQSFGIAAGESVRFVQPSASSIALNRVLGNNRSEIFGNLSANGQVFLINPNGVLFGRTAQVDVGGLVASTLDISTSDFMAGRTTFSGGNGGAVVNQGRLSAASGGYIALLGPRLSNEGVIEARMGTVALAAGNQVTLNFGGNSLVGLSVDRGVVGALAENQQLIQADGGRVLLSARAADDVVRAVVNNTGVIEANTVSNINGLVRLEGLGASTVTSSGTLRARGDEAGATGGTVQMLGERVGLMAGGQIDASGSAGGGVVLVGGDWQGKNAEMRNALRTFVAPDSSIKADAILNGDGGKVVVWSDDATRFYGTISVKGGAESGNGGAVEVSGKGYLDFSGRVNLNAPNGRGGELLIDPTDIIVAAAAGNLDTEINGTADPGILFADGAANTTLNVTELTTGFASGNTITLQATNNIRFDTNATLQSGVHLVLDAGNDINIGTTANATVTALGTGTLTLRADANGPNGIGSINIGSAATVGGLVAANRTITLQGANLVIDPTQASTTVNAGTTSGEVRVFTSQPASASIGVGTATGTLTLSNAELGKIAARTLTIGDGTTQVGNITFNGAAPVTGRDVAAAQLASGAGTIILDDASNTVVPLTTGAGNISLSAGTGGITASATNTTAEVSSTGTVTLNTSGPVGAGTNRVQFSTASGTPASVVIGNVTPSTTGVHLSGLGTGTLALGAITTAGSAPLDVTAGGDITASSGALTIAGTSSFSTTGRITLPDAGNDFTGAVTLAGTSVFIRDANALVLAPLSVVELTAIALTRIELSGSYSTVDNGTFTPRLEFSAPEIRLNGDTTVTSPHDLRMTGVVLGAHALTLNHTGAAVGSIFFNGRLGGTAPGDKLTALTIDTSAGLSLPEINVTGNVDIDAVFGVSQSGAMTVGGTSRFESTGAGDIILTSANVFHDTVTLVTGGGVSLRQDSDTIPLKVAPFTAAGAILDANPSSVPGGELQLSGSYEATLLDFTVTAPTIRLTGNTTITAPEGIYINVGSSLSNVIGPGALQLDQTSVSSGVILNGGPLGTIGAPLGGLTIHAANVAAGPLGLGIFNVDGNVDVTAAGGITSLGSNTVTGTSRFDTAGGLGANIILSGLNVFHDTVTLVSNNDVHLRQDTEHVAFQIVPLKVAPFTARVALIETTTSFDTDPNVESELRLSGSYGSTLGGFSIVSPITRLTGNTTITSPAGISIHGKVAGPGALQLDQTSPGPGGSIFLTGGTLGTFGNPPFVPAAPLGGLTVHSAGTSFLMTFAGANVAGNVDVTAANQIVSTGQFQVTGTSRFENTGGGIIDLSSLNVFHDTVTLLTSGEVRLRQESTTVPLKVAPFTADRATLVSNAGAGSELQLSGSYQTTSGAADFSIVAPTTRLTGNTTIDSSSGISISGQVIGPGALQLSTLNSATFGGELGTSGVPLAGLVINDTGTGNLSLPAINVGGNIDVLTAGSLVFAGNAAATGSLLARAAGGNLTIQGGTLSAGAGGNALTLATSNNLNVVSGGSLSLTGGGRWLVYSTSPAGSLEGGLPLAAGSTMPRLYNRTFAANGPGTITEPGNHLIYSFQPTLNVTADNLSRPYGDANPALTFIASGFVVDDSFTDTPTGAGLTGTLATTAVPTSPVAGSPYSIGSGTLASSAGYSILFTTGSLTVNPRPLTIAADNKSKQQGEPNPPLTATYSGFAPSESAANLTGTLLLSTPATTGSPGGSYAIAPSGQSSGNYAISFVDGTLFINGAPIAATSEMDERARVAIADADQQGRDRRGGGGRSEHQSVFRLEDGGIKLPEGER